MTDKVFDSRVKITDQALERKQRFRQHKDNLGLDQISWNALYPVTRVYFNITGEICCITSDSDLIPDDDWLTYEFSEEEIRMVSQNVSASRFEVLEIDGTYKIIVKGKKTPMGITQGADMLLVEPDESADVLVEVTKTLIYVKISPKICDQIEDGKIKGTKVLSFYVTALNNPQFMVYNFYVPMGDITKKRYDHNGLKDESKFACIMIPCDDDYTEYSIYTKPVFDSYGRI